MKSRDRDNLSEEDLAILKALSRNRLGLKVRGIVRVLEQQNDNYPAPSPMIITRKLHGNLKEFIEIEYRSGGCKYFLKHSYISTFSLIFN
ncbi:MAG: hypothetical protein M1476_01310 [Candidatus Thermoplasmatota archaeon]|nr:hypothetical protein [Candidatus Thermoplasmatota archaeon]